MKIFQNKLILVYFDINIRQHPYTPTLYHFLDFIIFPVSPIKIVFIY